MGCRVRVDIDASGDWDKQIADAVGATIPQVWSAVTTECRQLLRVIPNGLWPKDTGLSLKAWKLKRRVSKKRVDIRVFNLFDYAAIIANSPRIRGRTSVHYRAPERWISQNWKPILDRAAVRAENAARRAASRKFKREIGF